MEEMQRKVSDAVEKYKVDYADEYAAVVEQIKAVRDSLRDEWGSTKENKKTVEQGHVLEREIYRVPVTLDNLITNALTVDEFHHTSSKEYAKWFVTNFPEFRITKEY